VGSDRELRNETQACGPGDELIGLCPIHPKRTKPVAGCPESERLELAWAVRLWRLMFSMGHARQKTSFPPCRRTTEAKEKSARSRRMKQSATTRRPHFSHCPNRRRAERCCRIVAKVLSERLKNRPTPWRIRPNAASTAEATSNFKIGFRRPNAWTSPCRLTETNAGKACGLDGSRRPSSGNRSRN